MMSPSTSSGPAVAISPFRGGRVQSSASRLPPMARAKCSVSRFQRADEHALDVGVGNRPRRAGARLIVQALETGTQAARHLLTVRSLAYSFRATTLLAKPSPHSKTSRARRARCGLARARFANEISVGRSASVDLFHFLQGHDTRGRRENW